MGKQDRTGIGDQTWDAAVAAASGYPAVTVPTTKTNRPLVSVCVPTYNDGPFLLQSLESIINQTYTHLEILVGDDGSTDDTTEIIQSVKDTRIQYYRNSANLGQFENVNCCIQRAGGEYIAIYHSDDIYDPRIVEKEVNFLEAHPDVGAVFALDRWIDTDGRVFGEARLPKEVRGNTCLGLADVMPVLLRKKNCLLRTPTFMGRAEVFRRVGVFNTSDFDIASDLEMWLRILMAYKIAILDEPLMWYRCGATQVSSRYNRLRTCEEHFFPIVDRYLAMEDLAAVTDPTSLTEYAFHRCDDETFRAANLVIRGDTDEARELLQRSFPWRTFAAGIRRRKLRVLLLRSLMRGGLTIGAARPLSRLLAWTEYKGRI